MKPPYLPAKAYLPWKAISLFRLASESNGACFGMFATCSTLSLFTTSSTSGNAGAAVVGEASAKEVKAAATVVANAAQPLRLLPDATRCSLRFPRAHMNCQQYVIKPHTAPEG